MIEEVKSLTDAGIREFRLFILGDSELQPKTILDIYSRTSHLNFYIKRQKIPLVRNIMEFARFLNKFIPYTLQNRIAVYSDLQGIGTWLALRLLDMFVTTDENGQYQFLKSSYYIVDLKSLGGVFTHLVLTPWILYGIHGEDAAVYLHRSSSISGNPFTPNIYWDTFHANTSFLESRAVCSLIKKIFLNKNFEDNGVKNVGKKRELFRFVVKAAAGNWNLLTISEETLEALFMEMGEEIPAILELFPMKTSKISS